MKPILFLFTGMFFATLAGAEISIVRDTPEYYNFTVESPDRPVRLTLTLKNFPLEAGKNYWVTSSYQYAECVAAAKNGELDIAFPPVLRTAVTVAPFSGNLLPGGSFEDASAWLLEQKSGIMPVNGDRGTDGHYGRLLGKTVASGIGEIKIAGRKLLMRKASNRGVLLAASRQKIALQPDTEYLLSGFYTPHKGGFGTTLFLWMEITVPGGRTRVEPVRNINPVIIDGKRRYVRTIFRTPDQKGLSGSVRLAMGGPSGAAEWERLTLQVNPAALPQIGPEIRPERRKPLLSAQVSGAQLAAMKPVIPKVDARSRFPRLLLDGKTVPLFGFTANPLEPDPAKAGFRDFGEAGITLQWLTANLCVPDRRMKPLWTGFGQYRFHILAEQLRALHRQAPDARVLLYVLCDPGAWFFEKYPQAAWLDRNGSVIPGQWKGTLAVSYTSPDYLREVGKALYSLGHFLANDPAGKIVAGIHLSGGQDGQFFPQGNRRNWDRSENFRNALRSYLRERYGNDADALRKAWGDPELTFDSIEVPPESEREKPYLFLDPNRSADRRVIDVNRFWNLSTVRMLEHFARSFKAGIGRPALVTAYYNDIHGNVMGKSAAAACYRSPHLDGVVSCNPYGVSRRAGGSGGNGSSASIGLHGKYHLQEQDYRTEYSYIRIKGLDKNGIGATDGFQEYAAVQTRDLAAALSVGQGAWMFALSGNAWSHPAFMNSAARLAAAAKEVAETPQEGDHGQIAVFADERMDDCLSARGGFIYRLQHTFFPKFTLNLTGMSYDSYLLSDLTNPRRLSYRFHLFLSASSITEKEISYIERNLQKNNNILIFTTDAGRIAPGGFSANLKRLTGLNIRVNESKMMLHRYDPALPPGSLFGNNPFILSEGYGPFFDISPDQDTKVLAYYYGTEIPAAVMKKHPGWTAVYLALPGGFNPALLRNLAFEAGIVPVGPENDVVSSGNGILSLHATGEGMKTLRWTGRSDLKDLADGRIVAENTETFTFPAGIGETRIFRRLPPGSAKEKVSPPPLPSTVQVTCGAVKLELAKHLFWNLNGIWYEGTQVCRKGKGFYGTVIAFSGLGWVGTGHLENKIGEKEVKVSFLLDGREWQPGAMPAKGKSFTMKKSALLHQVRLEYEVHLENSRLRETAGIHVEKNSRIGIMYHFMHPWEAIFTEYLLHDRNGGIKEGKFDASNRNRLVPEPFPLFAAFYAPKEKIGFVSRVTAEKPITGKDEWILWNRGSDRKLYYVPVRTATLKSGNSYEWSMTTDFFTVPPDQWKKKAAAPEQK